MKTVLDALLTVLPEDEAKAVYDNISNDPDTLFEELFVGATFFDVLMWVASEQGEDFWYNLEEQVDWKEFWKDVD